MEHLKGIKRHILLLVVLSGILAYCSLLIPMYISYAIDGILFQQTEQIPHYWHSILEMDKIKGLMVWSIMMISITIIIAFTNYVRERITTKVTLKISSNLKKILYSHILKLNYKSYQSYSKVEMLQRVNEDAEQYANFYKVQFNLILDIISLSFFIVINGIALSVSITIYLLVTIVIMLIFALWYYRKMMPILEKVIQKKKKLLGVTIDNINQFKLVRIYNRQQEEIRKYKRVNRDYTKEDLKFIGFILFYDIISEHITYLSAPIIFLLGGISIMKGNMTLGTLATLVLFANKILGTLYTFGENLEVINTFLVIRQKIKKLMNLEEEKQDNRCYLLDGDITFHNVSIEISKREILSNLNFTIKKGEKIAIVGDNGSGKSVLAKAILGFYPVKGNLYINYHNCKQLDSYHIRQYIEFVSGEADLFSGTLLDNIKLDGKITEQQLVKAVKEAQIESDIKQFEERYETIVGEKGMKLSGGQKQRILITRALVRNKPIMIFDHAFSKIDAKTSDKILKNLVKNHPQTTMIFITHKTEIENYVNRIIQIREGTSQVHDVIR